VASFNDVICETTLDMYDDCIKAYKRKDVVKPFLEKKQAAKAKKLKAMGGGKGAKGGSKKARRASVTPANGKGKEENESLLAEDSGGGSSGGGGGGDDGAPNPALAFINQFRDMAGVGEIAEDAEWLELWHKVHPPSLGARVVAQGAPPS
jgi:hypothetical protein